MKASLFFLFYLLSSPCFSCECPPIEAFSKKNSATYDVIFYGTVDSIVPCAASGIGTAFFNINSLYKGTAEKKVSVDYDCTSACMMSFSKGDEWIIYASYQGFNLLTVNICSHSRKRISAVSADFYTISSGRSFDEENTFLSKTFGILSFSVHNDLNDKQKEFQPHNEQPSAINKLWLLVISLSVMLIIYFISKKLFKNGK
jgi:hypothetical protein